MSSIVKVQPTTDTSLSSAYYVHICIFFTDLPTVYLLTYNQRENVSDDGPKTENAMHYDIKRSNRKCICTDLFTDGLTCISISCSGKVGQKKLESMTKQDVKYVWKNVYRLQLI